MIYNDSFTVKTIGHTDVIDLTEIVANHIIKSGTDNGLVNLFIPGSTTAITTLEFEDGVIDDLKQMLEKIAPENYDYQHHQKWGDHNGAAHLRAALIGPSLTIPVSNGKLDIGTWQQIVLVDFDEHTRTRTIIIRILS